MQIAVRMFLFIMFVSFAVATEVNAFVTGAWEVVGSQTISIKTKRSKTHKDKLPQVQDLFVFSSDGDFSAEGLDGVGLWRQKGKSFKVKVDDPGVMETFFEDGFESIIPNADVTVKSFSVSGSESKGRMKGTLSFKIRLDDLLSGESWYISTTFKFTGTPTAESMSRGASRTEQGSGGLSDLIRQVIREVAPELAVAATN